MSDLLVPTLSGGLRSGRFGLVKRVDGGGPASVAGGCRDTQAAAAAVTAPGCMFGGVADGPVAQGAFVPCWGGRPPRCEIISCDEDVVKSWDGWLEVWMEDGGGMAFGSWSQLKREPKRKCWTTGNLERTSALYIFIMPYSTLSHACFMKRSRSGDHSCFTLLILAHPAFTPEISYNIGECSQNGPFFTS